MNKETIGEIITFYSYKGGTGRSMALANTACILAKKNGLDNDVLMIDWDLEAPGLHMFFQKKVENPSGKSGDLPLGQLGLIDLFYEIRSRLERGESEHIVFERLFSEIDIQDYIVRTNIPSLFLMPAGRFDDGMYSTRVTEFDWVAFYEKYPLAISEFVRQLKRKFQYVLIDSRTGYNDISGICTCLMPEKLVAVFTPNRQNLSGIVEVIRQAVEYRKQSDDLRPLMIFPLPSRIEDAENRLQKEWRSYYQRELETVLKNVYNLQYCDLTAYFDEYKLRYVPIYSYGEKIAFFLERPEDKYSLAHSFKIFTARLISNENSWEGTDAESYDFDLAPTSGDFNLPEPVRRTILQTGTFALIVAFSLAIYYFIVPLIPWRQFIYNLIHWEYFNLFVGIFLAIDLLWATRWQALSQRANKLLSKPSIFEIDKEPYDPPLYPRELLESLTKLVRPRPRPRSKLDLGLESNNKTFNEYLRDFVFNKEKPKRAFGYLLSTILFVFFMFLNVSVVLAVFVDIGLIAPNLHPVFQRDDLVILGGAIISAVTSIWNLIEMSGRGELIDTDSLSKSQKSLYKSLSIISIFLIILLMSTLILQSVLLPVYLPANSTFDFILTFVLSGLPLFINTISSVLVFQSAVSGFVVVVYIIISLLPVLILMADIIWRGVYILLDFTIWVIFTPILVVPYIINKLRYLIFGD